jgi:hypothetical protein
MIMEKTNKTDRKNNSLGFKERTAILDFLRLEDKCSTNDAGLAVYAEGWDDHKVAARLNVTANNVSSVREDMFGKVRKVPRKVAEADMLLELIDKVDTLEKQLNATLKRLDHLEGIRRGTTPPPSDRGAYLPLGNGDYPAR